MRKTLILTAAILFFLIPGFVSAQVFTAFGVHFDRFATFEYSGIEYSSIATINVVRGKPFIKNVTGSSKLFLLDSETKKFVNDLIFIRDTSDYRITFIINTSKKLMNQYSEVSGDTVRIHFPFCPIMNSCPVGSCRIELYQENEKQYSKLDMAALLSTEAYLHSDADIILERIFDNEKDSTVIIRNNYPEATQDILKGAKYYTLDYFDSRLKMSLEDYDTPTAAKIQASQKKYILHCSLYHIYPCNIWVER